MSVNGTVQTPESTTPKQKVRRWLSRATALVYGLVMFEVVIMVSPFAFYFYAAYGPTLKWLNHSAATAWLTGFMLPHAVFTTSPFLEFLRWDLGRYFFGLGLLGFFVLAAQIYGSKLFRRKVVSSGVYRYIRHPQYLCLGVSAFGLFTMWPRMIIFLLSGLTRSGKRTGGRLMYGMRIATVALLVAEAFAGTSGAQEFSAIGVARDTTGRSPAPIWRVASRLPRLLRSGRHCRGRS